jgi:hypothetical protein
LHGKVVNQFAHFIFGHIKPRCMGLFKHHDAGLVKPHSAGFVTF